MQDTKMHIAKAVAAQSSKASKAAAGLKEFHRLRDQRKVQNRPREPEMEAKQEKAQDSASGDATEVGGDDEDGAKEEPQQRGLKTSSAVLRGLKTSAKSRAAKAEPVVTRSKPSSQKTDWDRQLDYSGSSTKPRPSSSLKVQESWDEHAYGGQKAAEQHVVEAPPWEKKLRQQAKAAEGPKPPTSPPLDKGLWKGWGGKGKGSKVTPPWAKGHKASKGKAAKSDAEAEAEEQEHEPQPDADTEARAEEQAHEVEVLHYSSTQVYSFTHAPVEIKVVTHTSSLLINSSLLIDSNTRVVFMFTCIWGHNMMVHMLGVGSNGSSRFPAAARGSRSPTGADPGKRNQLQQGRITCLLIYQ